MSERADVARRVLRAVMEEEDAIALGLIAEDVEYVNPPGAIEPGTRRGHAGWRAAIASLYESWQGLEYHVLRVEETGDRVLMLNRLVMRGRASGVDTGFDQGLVITIRDGQVSRAEWYLDHASALAAMGIADET